MAEIVIFSGTTEGRNISKWLSTKKVSHFVCVASEYGEQVMDPDPYAIVKMGRLDENQMKQLFINENIKLVAEKDKEAIALVKSGLKDQAVVEVTNFTNARAAYIFDKWQHLENYLLVKYMDGNVKHQNPDGSFSNNGYSEKIPASPLHPEHSESWLRSIIQEHGDVIRVK